jgi:hypothetical protein
LDAPALHSPARYELRADSRLVVTDAVRSGAAEIFEIGSKVSQLDSPQDQQ